MQRPDIETMHKRLKAACKDPQIYRFVCTDLKHTFGQLGLAAESDVLIGSILGDIYASIDLEATERSIFAKLSQIMVGDKSLVQILDEKLQGRAEIIYEQVWRYFLDVASLQEQAPVIDWGTGDGRVAQLLSNPGLGLTGIVGYDVRDYRAQGVTIPIMQFDGAHVDCADGYFSAGLMTNVAHHEADNGKILRELARIIQPGCRLVVIETVPVSDDPVQFERTFVGDYVYNRLFHTADVPVPGTYETKEGWIRRFEEVGFVLDDEDEVERPPVVDLGYDQPTIRDWHVLYAFKRVG